jgi:Flp pilus assembly protein TadG
MLTRAAPGRTPAAGDRGSATVFTAVFAIAVIFLLGLIVDGGIAMNARQRAADIAGQAARAAADHIDITALRDQGAVVIAPGACAAASQLVSTYAQGLSSGGVDHVTSASMGTCVAPPGAHTATVQITIGTQPLVPGVLGGFTETAQASATTECGINQGGVCP